MKIARIVIGAVLLVVSALALVEVLTYQNVPASQMKAEEIALLKFWAITWPIMAALGLLLVCWPPLRRILSNAT